MTRKHFKTIAEDFYNSVIWKESKQIRRTFFRMIQETVRILKESNSRFDGLTFVKASVPKHLHKEFDI